MSSRLAALGCETAHSDQPRSKGFGFNANASRRTERKRTMPEDGITRLPRFADKPDSMRVLYLDRMVVRRAIDALVNEGIFVIELKHLIDRVAIKEEQVDRARLVLVREFGACRG